MWGEVCHTFPNNNELLGKFGTFWPRGCIWTVIYNNAQEIYSPRICLVTSGFVYISCPCSTCSEVFHCHCRCWGWKEWKISVGLVNVCCLVMVSGSSVFHCEKQWINIPSLSFPHSFNFCQPLIYLLTDFLSWRIPICWEFFHTEAVPSFWSSFFS